MSASGKSSNRHYEESSGYLHGLGHGPYADAGNQEYRNEQADLHRRGAEHNRQRCPECERR
jgi:hypothetical protein